MLALKMPARAILYSRLRCNSGSIISGKVIIAKSVIISTTPTRENANCTLPRGPVPAIGVLKKKLILKICCRVQQIVKAIMIYVARTKQRLTTKMRFIIQMILVLVQPSVIAYSKLTT